MNDRLSLLRRRARALGLKIRRAEPEERKRRPGTVYLDDPTVGRPSIIWKTKPDPAPPKPIEPPAPPPSPVLPAPRAAEEPTLPKTYDVSTRPGKRGFYRKGGRFLKVVELLKTGLSDREVERASGAAKATVGRIRAHVEAEIGLILCPCGLAATHRGWCTVRVRKSEKRRAFLARFGRTPPPATTYA